LISGVTSDIVMANDPLAYCQAPIHLHFASINPPEGFLGLQTGVK